MLNLNYCFYFSFFSESSLIKYNRNHNPNILYFTHFLSPGLKLYINLKCSSSSFCEFYFTLSYKKIEIRFIPMISYLHRNFFNRCTALKYDRCVNTGEPAAVCCFPIPIKVVELRPPESTAAGSLVGWSLVISH